jgi:hypothetical protein
MEHWNHFVDIQNDANILLNSTHFRDAILRQRGGATRWNSFRTALIESVNDIDRKRDFWTKLVGAYMLGKVGLKPYTAFKQIASYPLFGAYASNWYVAGNLVAYANPIGTQKQLKRAFELFPCIKERFDASAMGNEVMSTEYNSPSYKWNKTRQVVSKAAIWMNRKVDVITVAKGTLAVYDGMKREYLKKGMSESEADAKARIDAMIAYKATQQENTPEFLGSIQRENSAGNALLRAFKNSSFALARLAYIETKIASRNIWRAKNPRMVELEVERVMKAHPEYSREETEKEERSLMNRQIFHSFKTLASLGVGQTFFYLLSVPTIVLNLINIDDDDDKEEFMEQFWRIVAQVGLVTPANGLPIVGGLVESMVSGTISKFDFASIIPSISDIALTLERRIKEVDSFKDGAIVAIGTILDVLPTKVSPSTMYRMYYGIHSMIENGDVTMADIANLISLPPSEVKKIINHDYGDDESYINSYNWVEHLMELTD